uniref:tol-pal system protein YbgF n=1 Tax=Stappia sp. TaxID=1870903 RepID=UPI003BA8B709
MTHIRSTPGSRTLVTRLLAALLVLALVPAPASAQLFGGGSRDDGEAAVRLNQVEDQMRTLTGQVEQLSHQVRQLQEQIRRMQEDNEYRLQQLEQGGGGSGNRSDAGGAATPPAGTGAGESYGAAGPTNLGQLRLGSDGQPAADQGSGDAEFAREGGYGQDGYSQDNAPASGPLDLSALARGGQGGGADAGQPPANSGYDPAVPGSGSSGLAPVTGGGNAGASPGGQPSALAGGIPRDDYDSAYSMMVAGDYAGAETGFRRFLETHPNDPLSANAQFWIGESLYARKKYRDAADAFLKGYTDYPDSSKVTDSLLKLGLSLKGLGQTEAACATFSELLTKYPGAPTAVRAEAQSQKQSSGCSA